MHLPTTPIDWLLFFVGGAMACIFFLGFSLRILWEIIKKRGVK